MRRNRHRLLLLGCLTALGLATGCADGAAAPSGRTFRGAVRVVDGATGEKPSLTLDPGFPQLEITTRFFLRVRGSYLGVSHDLTMSIDPIAPPPSRFGFPADSGVLVLTYLRDTKPQATGNTMGFIQVSAADGDAGPTGEAVVSLVLSDAGNVPAVELDLVFKP